MNIDAKVMVASSALVVACAMAAPVAAAEIWVISTPAASTALKVAAADFERTTGHKVTVEYSNIAIVRRRVGAGEPFDIAIVSPKAIEELVQEGKIAAGATLNMGRTGLALFGRKGATRPDIGTVDSLKRTLLDARLVAYSDTGESGIGFLKVLDKLGIAEPMKLRIRAVGNMAAMVESGDAELGVTGVGAGLSLTRVEYIGALPSAVQEYVYMAAGVGVNGKSGDAARDLLKYLGEPAVVRAMGEKGLEPAAAK